MKIDEQIKQKLEEAIDILKKFGMPSAQVMPVIVYVSS